MHLHCSSFSLSFSRRPLPAVLIILAPQRELWIVLHPGRWCQARAGVQDQNPQAREDDADESGEGDAFERRKRKRPLPPS